MPLFKPAAGKSSPVSTAVGVGCLCLFALPFAAGGTFVWWLAASHVWQWAEARAWVETPAKLLAAKLETHGDEGTAYKATARYEYTAANQRYECEQVSFSFGSDNIGSFQEDKGRELERLLAAGGRTVCFVDPDDPQRAVLYRELRPLWVGFASAFGAVFALVGYGLLWGAWYGGRKLKADNARKAAHPEEPWLWREDWAAGRVRSQTKGVAIGAAIFAVLWNLVSWPAIVAVLVSPKQREWWLPLVVGIFPLVGTLLAAWAIKLWSVVWRWGTSEFELASVPGVLGGPVAGVIHGPPGIAAEEGFLLTLACIRRVTTGTGDNRHTEERELWAEQRRLERPLAAGPEETAIPVQFHAPFDQPATSDDGDVFWRLTVKAKTPGPDYEAQFDVPVFRTPASSLEAPAEDAQNDPLASYLAPTTAQTLAADLRAQVEYDGPDETVFYFPMTRNLGMSIFLLVFALGWTALCVGLYFSPAPRLIFYGFSFFAVLLVPAALSACFSTCRLRFGPHGVAVHRRWLVFGKPREFAAADVRDIGPVDSGTTYNGRAYQKLTLRTKGNEIVTLVSDIPSRATAQKLADWIEAKLTASDRSRSAAEDRAARRAERKIQLDSELPPELES